MHDSFNGWSFRKTELGLPCSEERPPEELPPLQLDGAVGDVVDEDAAHSSGGLLQLGRLCHAETLGERVGELQAAGGATLKKNTISEGTNLMCTVIILSS